MTGNETPAASSRPDPVPGSEVAAVQARHLRRILLSFLVVVMLLPVAGLGGPFAWLLLPLLLVAALGLREAVRLRRSVRRDGVQR